MASRVLTKGSLSKEDYGKFSIKDTVIQGAYHGPKHKGNDIANAIDGQKFTDWTINKAKDMGDAVYYATISDAGGNAIKTPYYSDAVKGIVYPDPQGRVRIINEEYMNTIRETEEYIENQVTEIMKYCVSSETSCKIALNLNDAQYDNMLGPNEAEGVKLNMSNEMAKLDGRILYIKSLPANSVTQSQALSKLRFITNLRREHFKMASTGRNKTSGMDEPTLSATTNYGGDKPLVGVAEKQKSLISQ